VRVQAREGYAVASEGAYLAALVTDLTPALVREGLAREFVRRVQDLRKTAGLEISDRIQLFYVASTGLAAAVADFQNYIMSETLTVDLVNGTPPEGAAVTEAEFDGEQLTVGLQVAH
jgi:isoleucyl-tRNA synthetase